MERTEYHYIYKITDTETGQYYIGMRSCTVEPELDPYMGSGMWIKEHAKEYGRALKNDSENRFEKQIIEFCGCRNELVSRETIIIGNLWKEDSLCMNRYYGGDGFGNGETNITYDPTVYHMWDHKTGTELFVTMYELINFHGGDRSALHKMKSGHLKSTNGISFYDNKDSKIRTIPEHKHHMWDHKTGTEIWATCQELVEIYGINKSSTGKLFDGSIIHLNRISLYENKDAVLNGRGFKYHLWNRKTEKEFWATQQELKDFYGFDNNVSNFCKEKLKGSTFKGICLYKNKDKPFRKTW